MTKMTYLLIIKAKQAALDGINYQVNRLPFTAVNSATCA